MTSERLIKITLDEESIVRWNADIDQERRVAIFDLLEQNSFAPVDDVQGPYCLHLGIVENRLLFDLSSEAEVPLCKIVLPTSPMYYRNPCAAVTRAMPRWPAPWKGRLPTVSGWRCEIIRRRLPTVCSPSLVPQFARRSPKR